MTTEVLPLDKIVPHPGNIRRDLGDIEGLAESVRQVGLLEPLVVRRMPDGRYQLAAGHRRFEAAKLAGLPEVECSVRELSDSDVLEVMLIENLQREDVHPLDKARIYHELVEMGRSQREIATKTGRSQADVSKSLRLLDLPAELAVELHRKPTDDEREAGQPVGLTLAQADVLLALKDHPDRMVAAFRKSRDRQEWRELPDIVDEEVRLIEGETKKVVALAAFAKAGVTTIVEVDRIDGYYHWRPLGKAQNHVPIAVKAHRPLPCHAGVVDRYGTAKEVCTTPSSHAEYKGYSGGAPAGRARGLTDKEKAERAATRARNRELKEAAAVRIPFMRDLVNAAGPLRGPLAQHLAGQWIASLEYSDEKLIAVAVELLGLERTKGDRAESLQRYARSGGDALGRAAAAVALGEGEWRVQLDQAWQWNSRLINAHYEYLVAHGYEPATVEMATLKERAK